MFRKKPYYLVDLEHGKPEKYAKDCLQLSANISLWHGETYTEELIHKFWEQKEFAPSETYLRSISRTKYVKWRLLKGDVIQDEVWNGNFIGGLLQNGYVNWNRLTYPSFIWIGNNSLHDLIAECPYYCDRLVLASSRKRSSWIKVPAMYLPCDENSLEFLAGALSGGEVSGPYIKYSKCMADVIDRFGIPTERQTPDKKITYISPIWPAIMSLFMPDSCFHRFNNILGDNNAELYASILWRIYHEEYAKSKSMPYLKSYRTAYNRFGNVKELETLRVKMKMVELDHRFAKTIQGWTKELYNIKNNLEE
tara:strand:- start:13174 stop:14097 length:924 start_codon:yes stop_codon:yes gene_type:complete